MDYGEIFGEKEIIRVDKPTTRDGLLGPVLDFFLGKKIKTETEVIRKPAMNLRTFLTYLELMRMDQEEQKRAKKRAKMQSKMKGRGGLAG